LSSSRLSNAAGRAVDPAVTEAAIPVARGTGLGGDLEPVTKPGGQVVHRQRNCCTGIAERWPARAVRFERTPSQAMSRFTDHYRPAGPAVIIGMAPSHLKSLKQSVNGFKLGGLQLKRVAWLHR